MSSLMSPWQCNQCDVECYAESRFNKHYEKLHITTYWQHRVLSDPEPESEPEREEIMFINVIEQKQESEELNKQIQQYEEPQQIERKTYDGEIFKCTTCNHEAKNKQHAKNHKRTHTKPFKCEECTKCFSQKAKLEKHFKDVHEGHKEFICLECSYKSNDKGHFNRHTNIVHSNNSSLEKCELCPKVFAEKGQLKQHMNVHYKRNEFPCTNCAKKYFTQQQLTQHSLSHRERNFVCNMCQKRFKEKKKLESHVNTHTKEKLYKCQTYNCKFEAKQNSNLTAHKKRKHSNED